MFALHIFTARATIVLAVRKCPVDTCRQEKTSPFLVRFGVRVTYFCGQGNYRPGVGTVRWTVPAGMHIVKQKKSLLLS